ncbi:hypothetical protein HDE_09364 [Halotydeus destructor]|nr:hypothetical protein HDE_09364 [Halotydeus destructor]
MSWIISYLDRFNCNFTVECDLEEFCNNCKSVQQEPISGRLTLDQLSDDELVCIFRWLKPKELIGIERVSKQFFLIVAETFHELKYITEKDIEDFKDAEPEYQSPEDNSSSRSKFMSYVNRFGPSLQTLPFDFVVSQLQTGKLEMKCDEDYLKQLGKRFRKISDFGLLDESTITFLLVNLKASDRNENLRKLTIQFDIKTNHILDKRAIKKFEKQLNAIFKICPRLDKLRLGLDTNLPPSTLVNKFIADFGRLTVKLFARMKRLLLFDRAALSFQQHLSGPPVELEQLKPMLVTPHYFTDRQVIELCRFAPSLKRLTLRAEVSVLKHLIVLKKLVSLNISDLHPLEVPFPASRRDAEESMKTFLKTVGKRLDKLGLCLLNKRHSVPITKWLSEYCPNIVKLQLGINYEHQMSKLKLPKLKQFEYHVFVDIVEKEFEAFFRTMSASALLLSFVMIRKRTSVSSYT